MFDLACVSTGSDTQGCSCQPVSWETVFYTAGQQPPLFDGRIPQDIVLQLQLLNPEHAKLQNSYCSHTFHISFCALHKYLKYLQVCTTASPYCFGMPQFSESRFSLLFFQFFFSKSCPSNADGKLDCRERRKFVKKVNTES